MRRVTQNILKTIFFKRSQKYRCEPELEKNWSKLFIEKSDKRICVLSKIQEESTHPIVVLAHPYLSDAKLFFIKNGHTDTYINLGLSVVLLDFNGFGESPFVNFNFEEDIALVAEYISNNYPHRRIILHGISFGASHTITYSKFAHNRAHKIIIENCLDSNLSYYKKRNRKIFIFTKLLMAIYPSGNKNHNYVKSISQLKNIEEVLLIYNNDDDLTTPQMGNKLKDACNRKNKMELFPGKHLKALKESPDRYKDTIRTFIWGT